MRLCVVTVIATLITNLGCAQTYIPGRYYRTVSAPAPVVYTTQPVVTYASPVYRGAQVVYIPVQQSYGQPPVRVVRQSIVRNVSQATSRPREVYTQMATMPQRVNAQVAESESDFRKRMEDADANFKKEIEKIEREIACQTEKIEREIEQAVTRARQKDNVIVRPTRANRRTVLPEVNVAPPMSVESSVVPSRASAKRLAVPTTECREKTNNEGTELAWSSVRDKAKSFAQKVTNFLQTAPWWAWVLGVIVLFVVVFILSIRDAQNRQFRPRNDNPWVIDPAN